MARVKIDLPSKFIFQTEIPIRITDLNYNDHLGNDAILSLIHEARVRFFKSMNYSELDVEGVGIIMIDSAIRYKSEGFYGDVLLIELAIDDITSTGFDFKYRLTNKESRNVVAVAKTGIAFFDYDSRKVVPIPDKFVQKIKNM